MVEVNLFNSGVNSNQNRLIFFSQVLFGMLENGENIDFFDFVPNFSLPTTDVFPLPTNLQKTCFIARLVKFWGKYIIFLPMILMIFIEFSN